MCTLFRWGLYCWVILCLQVYAEASIGAARIIAKFERLSLVKAKVNDVAQHHDEYKIGLQVLKVYIGEVTTNDAFSVDQARTMRQVSGNGVVVPKLSLGDQGIWALQQIGSVWYPIRQIPYAPPVWPVREDKAGRMDNAEQLAREIDRILNLIPEKVPSALETGIDNPNSAISIWCLNALADAFPDRIHVIAKAVASGKLSVGAQIAADRAIIKNAPEDWRHSTVRHSMLDSILPPNASETEALEVLNYFENLALQKEISLSRFVSLLDTLIKDMNTSALVRQTAVGAAARNSLKEGPDNPAFGFVVQQFREPVAEQVGEYAANALALVAARNPQVRGYVRDLEAEFDGKEAGRLLSVALKRAKADE